MDPPEPPEERDKREPTGGGRPVPVGGRGSPPPGQTPAGTGSQWPASPPTGVDPETRVDLSGLRRLSEDPPPVKPERRSRDGALPRMVAFFVAAVIFAVAPWYVFTRVLKDDTPSKPSAAASTTPSPTPTPTASPSSAPGTYEVANLTKCMRVRAAPGTDQVVKTCLNLGVRVTSDGRTANADGIEWMHVTYKQIEGWASTQYLKKVG
jgi:hypothetical protein